MATKKSVRASAGRPDKYSKKRSGFVTPSLRMLVAEAKMIRQAATAKRMSAHSWMLNHLIAAAKRELAEAQQSPE